MQPHTHISAVHLMASAVGTMVVFGTAHLLAITRPENRLARAWLALGF